MKNSILAAFLTVCASMTVSAQSLNVNCGNTTYSFNSAQTGEMTYQDGETLTIQGRQFSLADIATIKVVDDVMADNLVTVTYAESSAQVTVSGNIAQYISVSHDGAYVTITQGDEVGDDTCGEITYRLSGASTRGSFTLAGAYKSSIELNGLTLTSARGAAIDIQNGKRTAVRVTEGTVNTLADVAGGSQKACLYCKGHFEFKQKGELRVTGNTGHAISAKEYIEIKNTKIYVTGAVKDGINCNQHFTMESGTLDISGVGDDGIQTAFKDDVDRELEDTGTVTITGGTLTINVTADAAKAIKADGDFVMSKGSITATVSGKGIWDSTGLKTKASSCISADGRLDISGGSFTLLATGAGGKGLSANGEGLITGGEFDIVTEGKVVVYTGGKLYNGDYTGNLDRIASDYKSSPKGIKVDGALKITGGTFKIWTKGTNGEGIETKTTLTIDGGDFNIRAYDDGINSSSHAYINGGTIVITTGAGDAIDSNANIYIAGGNLTVVGAASPEQGFDAGDGYGIFFTGGTFLAACGGNNSVPSTGSTQSTQAYVSLSKAVSAGQTVTVADSSGVKIASFTIPASYSSTTAAVRALFAPGGGGWGWGGSSGGSLVISCPEMVSGNTYTITIGTTSTTATAKK